MYAVRLRTVAQYKMLVNISKVCNPTLYAVSNSPVRCEREVYNLNALIAYILCTVSAHTDVQGAHAD